ncbi:hypothetical protein MJO29_014292 [Puccinia striiformis f. sp. tritici]|nr:hypothetical protein MJO29_014292 [Puccinia striiformis f. sp. tritici]
MSSLGGIRPMVLGSSRISLSTLNLPQPHPNIVNILDIDRSNPHSSSISSSSLIDIARHPIPIIFLVISSSEGPASCSFQFDHYLFRVQFQSFSIITIQLSTKDETTQNQANREQSETLQPNSPANKQKTQLENPQQTMEPEVNHVDDLEEVVEEEGLGLVPSTIDDDDDDLIICG